MLTLGEAVDKGSEMRGPVVIVQIWRGERGTKQLKKVSEVVRDVGLLGLEQSLLKGLEGELSADLT